MTTVTVTIELAPFPVPDAAIIKRPPGSRADGAFFNDSSTSMKLNELSYETLDTMCQAWRAEVFRRAGVKDQPPNASTVSSPTPWDQPMQER